MTPTHQEIKNKCKKMLSLYETRTFLNFSLEVQELSHVAFSKDGPQGPATVGKSLIIQSLTMRLLLH